MIGIDWRKSHTLELRELGGFILTVFQLCSMIAYLSIVGPFFPLWGVSRPRSPARPIRPPARSACPPARSARPPDPAPWTLWAPWSPMGPQSDPFLIQNPKNPMIYWIFRDPLLDPYCGPIVALTWPAFHDFRYCGTDRTGRDGRRNRLGHTFRNGIAPSCTYSKRNLGTKARYTHTTYLHMGGCQIRF